jgi:hypothetical protein
MEVWRTKMNFRKLMYVVIIAICISSIGIGVYEQFGYKKKTNTQTNTTGTTNTDAYTGETQEELKQTFDNMFDNQFHIGEYDTKNISKLDGSKEIVYTVYSSNNKTDNYEVNLNIPVINISGDVATKFNTVTQNVFANKANEIFKTTTLNNIYTISYTGFMNGDIMSVIIKSTLKEDANAQRTMVQTYNYNLKTGKEVTINDAIEQRGTTSDDVTKKINTQVKEAIKEANDIQVTGYEVYTRNIDSDMYKFENADTFFLGDDGALYIIYAYGNTEFTSEMDIIVI